MSGTAPAAAERYAEVVVDIAAASTDRVFHYRLPASLSGVQPGCHVLVPFGPRRVSGFVVGLTDHAPLERQRIRDVLRVLDREPVLPEPLISLCRWVSERYFCLLVQALRAALPPPARRRRSGPQRLVALEPLASPDRLAAARDDMAPRAPRQAEVLEALLHALRERTGPVPLADLPTDRPHVGVLRALERKGLVRRRRRDAQRDPYPAAGFAREPLHRPSDEQARALAAISEPLQARRHASFLLEGVTGSGKTEVYLHAIRRVLCGKRGAIVLTPEISLTPQLIDRFKRTLGTGVAVLHSALSEGERHDEWRRVRAGRARVVIGARSAVFAPVADLGLVVVDEEHAASYKQEEAPRYHAREVARQRAREAGAVLVLGSATPSVETVHGAGTGEHVRLRLTRRVNDRPMPATRVVDMRDEHRAGQRGVFSRRLRDAVSERLRRGEQVLLFINRRGHATVVLCRECGAVVRCPHCEVSLTYHRPDGHLRCHYCGLARRPPERCPGCEGVAVGYFGAGTQRVEQETRRLFPGARVERVDADTMARRGSHERIYRAFRAGELDVLVGTQMIARGWDVPAVTLVGAVAADVALHLPDFRSAERTFELLLQVAGRAGRGDEPGEVYVQTYNPEHYALRAALRGEAEAFYARELAARRDLGFPPFRELVRVLVQAPAAERAAEAAAALAQATRPVLTATAAELWGPSPAALARVRGLYRWQLLLKLPRGEGGGALRADLRRTLERARAGLPDDVRVALDVDPQSML